MHTRASRGRAAAALLRAPVRLLVAGVGEQAIEPLIEPIDVTQASKVPPGADIGVLDRVLRCLGIAQDESSRRVKPGGGRSRQHREGVMVASLRLLNEFALVHMALGPGAAAA